MKTKLVNQLKELKCSRNVNIKQAMQLDGYIKQIEKANINDLYNIVIKLKKQLLSY